MRVLLNAIASRIAPFGLILVPFCFIHLSLASGRTGERGSAPRLLGRSNICDSSLPETFLHLPRFQTFPDAYIDCSCLPNSCFRSGNSLGRVSMIDGCLSHIISEQSIPLVILVYSLSYEWIPCPEGCLIRGPEVLGSWDESVLGWDDIYTSSPLHNSPSSIFTLQPSVSRPTSDGQTHFKSIQALSALNFVSTVLNLDYLHLFICKLHCLESGKDSK